nr:amino acid ABC transporter permease [Acinetobacter baumannii]
QKAASSLTLQQCLLIWIFRKLEKRWLAFLKPSNH